MAFTRFHDDDARIARQLQQQTDQERWYLDVPGNGDRPCFVLDPQILPQKWGANLFSHVTDVQSSLLGLNTPLTRDCSVVKKRSHTNNVGSSAALAAAAAPLSYPVCDRFLTTEQSRAILPAWTLRETSTAHTYLLPKDPQQHTEMAFANNVSSRILEKDNFRPCVFLL